MDCHSGVRCIATFHARKLKGRLAGVLIEIGSAGKTLTSWARFRSLSQLISSDLADIFRKLFYR